jgi:hypothetical protein
VRDRKGAAARGQALGHVTEGAEEPLPGPKEEIPAGRDAEEGLEERQRPVLGGAADLGKQGAQRLRGGRVEGGVNSVVGEAEGAGRLDAAGRRPGQDSGVGPLERLPDP